MEVTQVKNAFWWAVGMTLGLLAVSFVLRQVGAGSFRLAPEDVVEGGPS